MGDSMGVRKGVPHPHTRRHHQQQQQQQQCHHKKWKTREKKSQN